MLPEIWVTFTFAFLAGVSSLCHPCSFALLPSYIAYLIGSKTFTHGIFSGSIFTSGLITSLAFLGALLSLIGGILIDFIPWIQMIIAIIIILLGIVQLLELSLPSYSPKIHFKEGLLGLYVFGLGFGLVISGCSAPVFFSIILYSFISGFQIGILALTSYGLGMGVITMVVTLITIRAKQSILNKLSQYSTWINRIIGIILVIAGVYILYLSLPMIH